MTNAANTNDMKLLQEIGALRRMKFWNSMVRSQQVAKLRCRIKRRLRAQGHSFHWNITTRELIANAA